MIIKVCGVKTFDNYQQLKELDFDWIGLNFYPSSKRYIQISDRNNFGQTKSKKKVGVFVNEEIENVIEVIEDYKLDFVQLHGTESPDYCNQLSEHCQIIKVFSVDDEIEWEELIDYMFCDYFLFDTKTELFGGSGNKFDWSMLDDYELDVPFLIAGGIGPDDVNAIKAIDHSMFVGIDINSRFEIEPGIKDSKILDQFITKIKEI